MRFEPDRAKAVGATTSNPVASGPRTLTTVGIRGEKEGFSHMNRRIRFGLAFAAMSLVTAVGAQAVLAAGGAHLKPANTQIKVALKAGTTTTFTGKVGPATVTQHCTSSTDSFKTPAHGLGPITIATPTFSGCTDSLHGTDMVMTSGKWTEKFLSAGRIRLTVPKAGATVMSSVAPGCVITVAPKGPASITGAYANGTTKFANVSLPSATSAACPGGASTGTATYSATYVSTPHVKVVP